MSKIIIGSRGSELALWQANHTQDRLVDLGHEVEIKIIKKIPQKSGMGGGSMNAASLISYFLQTKIIYYYWRTKVFTLVWIYSLYIYD
jgi:4-diphosphocytidyl-2C-methyl-D-erythritol kinase